MRRRKSESWILVIQMIMHFFWWVCSKIVHEYFRKKITNIIIVRSPHWRNIPSITRQRPPNTISPPHVRLNYPKQRASERVSMLASVNGVLDSSRVPPTTTPPSDVSSLTTPSVYTASASSNTDSTDRQSDRWADYLQASMSLFPNMIEKTNKAMSKQKKGRKHSLFRMPSLKKLMERAMVP